VNPADYLAAIRADGEAVLAAARNGFDSPVPTTPGWTVGDVIAHLGKVHREKAHIVRELLVDEPPEGPDAPAEDHLLEWFAEGVHDLTSVLSVTDPSTHVHTWHEPDQTVGFWIRRMAHETLIHRVDIELGHGSHTPVDPILGADGVDEILDAFMEGYPPWAEYTPTDIVVAMESEGRSWRLRFGSWTGTSPRSGREFTDEAAITFDDSDTRPAATIHGPGDALDLFLWGRGSADGLIVDGHPSVLLFLRDLAAESTQ
jgi:uncharacterized protein (TIGR03083 family)